jgi:hypothetical protein
MNWHSFLQCGKGMQQNSTTVGMRHGPETVSALDIATVILMSEVLERLFHLTMVTLTAM